ncbi:glucosaminidase domain-containing protein [Dictyobacter aurantiacus]|uniref:Mannosyl-glycoprotein endo-beta-N-acetylglucosamidase-like domain-containing protein n=1 Tax=Dictyobacter aurantiacus TaxID=1936993 RepID=A0A401ZD14_9CHLR|nr:glucosaminidase domain-containing protein [Dictyobacter aurantiacus]GCE04780.1 hypothetical protein KDAU_21090 [Dictyobacter aurantiacus]
MRSFGSTLLILLVVAVGGYIALGSLQPSKAVTSTPLPSQTTVLTSDRLVGPPSVTAAFMNTILEQAGSPAKGLGSSLYELGKETGIDPVYALAFFHHESSFGLRGVAATTHSLGNIRCTAGWTCDPSGGYRSYETWILGAEDWFNLMQHVYIDQGLDTVTKIIPKYAPTADHNDEHAYIQAVCDDVARWRAGQV